MKKILLILLFSILLFGKETKIEKIDYVNEISILIGNSENGFNQNIGRSLAYQLQFQYNDLNFPIKPEISFVYSQDIPLYYNTEERTTRYSTIMTNGVYEIEYSKLLTPYIKGGISYTSFANVPNSPKSGLSLDTGAGVKLHLSDRFSLKFETIILFNKNSSNFLATGGINFKFGKKYEPQIIIKKCEPCMEQKPQPKPVPIYITKKAKKIFIPINISFELGKSSLTEESKREIKKYIKDINSKQNINKNILIIGNTDDIGTRSFNATLSIKRASSVKIEFIKNDVNPKRINIDGLGEMNPIADNKTEEGREKNRRVLIILTNKTEKK